MLCWERGTAFSDVDLVGERPVRAMAIGQCYSGCGASPGKRNRLRGKAIWRLTEVEAGAGKSADHDTAEDLHDASISSALFLL